MLLNLTQFLFHSFSDFNCSTVFVEIQKACINGESLILCQFCSRSQMFKISPKEEAPKEKKKLHFKNAIFIILFISCIGKMLSSPPTIA